MGSFLLPLRDCVTPRSGVTRGNLSPTQAAVVGILAAGRRVTQLPAGGRRSRAALIADRNPLSLDRGRGGFRLPSLRTVRAVLPHTALQSVVLPP
jgi:hypothetical protein